MRNKLILLISVVAICFSFGCGDPVQPKATNIVAPIPVAPPDGNNVTQPFTFRWSGTADKLEIDYTPSFSPSYFAAAVSGNQYNMPPDTLASRQVYYWRVGYTVNNTTYWSKEVWHFTTN